jgi:predicted GIY-YIG superfamily endonuclease
LLRSFGWHASQGAQRAKAVRHSLGDGGLPTHQQVPPRGFGWREQASSCSTDSFPSHLCRGQCAVNVVYILQSPEHPDQFYPGLCIEVRARLAAHKAGQSPHTSKHKPWRLLSCQYFHDERTAAAFERYLKGGSGRAFASKRPR